MTHPQCSAATVQVRPLEWDEGKGELAGQLVWSSGDPWVFWIVKNPNEKYIWCENFNIEGFCPCSPVRGSYDTLDEAKAAAQADYDERIRAAVILNEPQEAWQPIKTAPTGVPVLAMEDFHREDEDGKKYPKDYQVVTKINGKWSSFGLYLESFEPTHWQQLPSSPLSRPQRATQ
ncbi:hypothetical protein J2R95_003168 [Bradyrhizobium japonicum]|uniref:DUF551 domain-containing protein n=1 Tax=Bradyrhizobium japonicum TaxID=375 RepID=UPI00209E4F49|nr:DUF551 domain-containing protein [Bradyrhizobium japonicum]MCP1937373.1 hypothetical protein [Bradyrhizobium japonicum]